MKFSASVLAVSLAFSTAGFSVLAETVTVGPGDTLWSIAQQENTTVDKLKQLNPGLNPYGLQFGAQVIINHAPDDSTEVYHIVSPGLTLYSIATLHKGVTLSDLYAWNPGIDPFNLKIGSKVRVVAP